MELVLAASGNGKSDSRSVQIDPASRRVANIRTVAVKSMEFTRTLRAVGELHYDEGSLKTISAYVDGRIDRLYADYTGVLVEKGDQLALVYSPRLYSAQVELLLAKKADVGEWFYAALWRQSAPPMRPRRRVAMVSAETSAPAKTSGTWLVLSDELGLGAHVAERLARGGAQVIRVAAGSGYHSRGEGRYEIRPQVAEDVEAATRLAQH